MKRILALISVYFVSLSVFAQMPPANMYQNLGVYKSVAVYEDGEKVPFTGTDYFYIDFGDDGEISALFYNHRYGQWESIPAETISSGKRSTTYSTYNSEGEDLSVLVLNDLSKIRISKDNDDISIVYKLINGSEVSTPSYSGGSGSYSGGYSSGSSSSSGRTCISCNGTGKCKTCDGKGYYYQETGYYVGRSGKTRTDCPVCHGTGRCGTCHGNGTIR